MESKYLKEIRAAAEAYDKKLRADDPRFRRDVHIIHEDGSTWHLHSAFLMQAGDWIVCFTEHFGILIFDHSDLDSYWESERRYQALEEMP